MYQRRPISRETVKAAACTFIAGIALVLLVVACGPGPTDDPPPPTGDTAITITVVGDGRATLEALDFTCSDTCTIGVDEGTEISLAAVPNAGRVLVAWDGPCSPFDDDCVWHAEAGTAVTVTFASHALRFDLAGDGEGYFEIDAAGDAIECREACGVALEQPLAVTITYFAEGSARTTLDPWIGACSEATESEDYCLVNVESVTTIGKIWRHPPIAADFSATIDQGSPLTVDPPGVLAGVDDTPGDTHTASLVDEPVHGDVVLSHQGSFTYVPYAGFVAADQFTFRVTDAFGNTSDATATVSVRPRLTLAKEGDGSVSSVPPGIACDASCTTDIAHFDIGSSVTLTAEAQPGNTFSGWTSGPCDGSGAPTCDVTMNGPKSITATFSASTYTLDVTRTGNGTGNVTSVPSGIDLGAGKGSATFAHGTSITLTATATGISVFTEWSAGPCDGSSVATCTFTITDDTTVEATFSRRRPFTGVSASEPGIVPRVPEGVDLDDAADATITTVAASLRPIGPSLAVVHRPHAGRGRVRGTRRRGADGARRVDRL